MYKSLTQWNSVEVTIIHRLFTLEKDQIYFMYLQSVWWTEHLNYHNIKLNSSIISHALQTPNFYHKTCNKASLQTPNGFLITCYEFQLNSEISQFKMHFY